MNVGDTEYRAIVDGVTAALAVNAAALAQARREGAAEMRERCAAVCDAVAAGHDAQAIEDAIRALPLPGDAPAGESK